MMINESANCYIWINLISYVCINYLIEVSTEEYLAHHSVAWQMEKIVRPVASTPTPQEAPCNVALH